MTPLWEMGGQQRNHSALISPFSSPPLLLLLASKRDVNMGLTVAVIVHQFAMCPRGIANQARGHSRHPNVLPQDWQVGEALGKAKCVLENTRQCPCAQGRIGFCIFSCHTACKNQNEKFTGIVSHAELSKLVFTTQKVQGS